jgi:hypothetical protein
MTLKINKPHVETNKEFLRRMTLIAQDNNDVNKLLRMVQIHHCLSCGNEIARSVCQCGVRLDDHDRVEHPFVPMGCDCLRSTR